jgi:hypothetical protein
VASAHTERSHNRPGSAVQENLSAHQAIREDGCDSLTLLIWCKSFLAQAIAQQTAQKRLPAPMADPFVVRRPDDI